MKKPPPPQLHFFLIFLLSSNPHSQTWSGSPSQLFEGWDATYKYRNMALDIQQEK
jgi:hypothetical protein